MANATAVYARIDTSLKNHTEGNLRQFGITPSSAIQMLYSQIVLTKRRPSAIHTGCQPVRLKGRRPAKEGRRKLKMPSLFNVLVCILALLVGVLIGKTWKNRKK